MRLSATWLGQLSGTNGRVHPIVLALGDVGESFAAIYSTQLFSVSRT